MKEGGPRSPPDLLVPHMSDGPEPLRPYRALCADQMVIHGTGSWDLCPYLPPSLLMPFREPAVLAFSGTGGPHPTFAKENVAETLALMKVWDAKGLLVLRPAPVDEDRLTRVFGAWKAPGKFRQIGDRRGQNSYEAKLRGPSCQLPTGQIMTRLSVPRFTHQLLGSSVDRKDFYHQAKVSRQKAFANATGPVMSLSDFRGTGAYDDFLGWAESLRRGGRALGDQLHQKRRALLVSDSLPVFGCFSSLFQGDAGGVEYATAAHAGFLEHHGVLPTASEGRLLSGQPVASGGPWVGLVIDDLFAIASRPAHPSSHAPGDDPASALLLRAKEAYNAEGLLGSDDKDCFAQSLFTVAGAQVDSTWDTVKAGITSVGAPAEKRFALSLASLKVASGRFVSEELASILAGSWVSCLLFRRCLMAAVNDLFRLAPKETSFSGSRLVPLGLKPRQELVLLAVLAPVLVSNVAVPFSSRAYASDASLQKGAYTYAEVGQEVSFALWLSSDLKGHYTKLDSPERSALRRAGHDPENLDRDVGIPHPDELGSELTPAPQKPLALCFDFMEICGGSGRVSGFVASAGYVTGPVIDIERSPEYDLQETRVLEWILYMLQEGRLSNVMVQPPCTTFSGAAHPCLRSYRRPEGFDRRFPRTRVGNRLAFAALVILWCAWRVGAGALIEQPRTSKMRWLKAWRYLSTLPGVEENWLASCAYGAPFRKEFGLIGCGVDLASIHRRCPRNHKHIVIQGSLTKASAVYWPEVAEAFASLFIARLSVSAPETPSRSGLESVLVNEVLSSKQWEHGAAWAWKRLEHVNVLEARAYLKVQRDLARHGGDLRYPHVVDSAVVQGAFSKGRSSARSLQKLLAQSAATQVAAGLYPGNLFGPTRLNTADDPTRNVLLRPPSRLGLLGGTLGFSPSSLFPFSASEPASGKLG